MGQDAQCVALVPSCHEEPLTQGRIKKQAETPHKRQAGQKKEGRGVSENRLSNLQRTEIAREKKRKHDPEKRKWSLKFWRVVSQGKDSLNFFFCTC